MMSIWGPEGGQGLYQIRIPHCREQCVELLARGQSDDMLNRIYKAFEAYKRNFDLVVLEGTHADPQAVGVPPPSAFFKYMLADMLG